MADDHILAATSGDRIIIDFGPVTRLGVAIDLRLTGTRIAAVFKRKRTDADGAAVFDHRYNVGVVENNGLTVPNTGSKNVGFVTIEPSESSGFTKTELLAFDVVLREPDGRITTLRSGMLKVAASTLVGDP